MEPINYKQHHAVMFCKIGQFSKHRNGR